VYFVLILPNNYSDRKTERKKELYTTATVHHWVQQADDRTVHTNHKTQLQHIMMVYYPSVYWNYSYLTMCMIVNLRKRNRKRKRKSTF